MDVFVDVRIRLADRVSQQDHSPYPANSADDVIDKIARILHPCGAGYRGTKGPDDGDESRQDNRLGAVTFIKLVSARQMALLKKPRILAAEQGWARFSTDQVAQLVAGNGA